MKKKNRNTADKHIYVTTKKCNDKRRWNEEKQDLSSVTKSVSVAI